MFTGVYGVPKQMVAEAAHGALLKLDHEIGSGTVKKIQSIHYVNLDAETTAAFIEAFSNRQRSQRRGITGEAGDNTSDLQMQRADHQLAVDLSTGNNVDHSAAAELESFTTISNSPTAAGSHTPVPKCSDPYKLVTSCGVDVEIYCGNLLDEKVEAIVNPANTQLRHGGGAARAIAEAAGSQLQEECRAYISEHKELKVTQAMHTSAGRLFPPVIYVIHAVGPSAAQFPNPDELYQAVFDTFYHCLLYANNHLHVSSLSIPAISSGE